MGTVRELRPEELRAAPCTEELCFEDTREVVPLDRTVGQERALRALKVGLEIDAPGFNIFIAGRSGTGRTSIVKTMVEKVAQGKPVPSDWIFLYNFTSPDRPRAFSLPSGQASRFAAAVEELVSAAFVEMHKMFESPLYLEKHTQLESEAGHRKQELIIQLQKEVANLGFSLEFSPQGILTVPTAEGKKLSSEEFEALPEETREKFRQGGEKVHELLEASMLESRKVDRDLVEQMRTMERDLAISLLGPLFEKLEGQSVDFTPLLPWLDEMKTDLVSNLDLFRDKEGETPPKTAEIPRYKVNAFIDRGSLTGAPLVLEMNPSYYNLVGKIEYRSAFGTYITDQTMIKAGAIAQANGGYLVLPAQELLSSPFAWEALKRALRSQELRVENLSEFAGGVPTVTLRPEPIPAHLTVILVGQPEHYNLLYNMDEDFRKLFKIRADFDLEMPRNSETIGDYARFVRYLGEGQECALPFHPSAVATLVEYGSRLANSQKKLSARFADISDIAYEACYWARREQNEKVLDVHVAKALEEKTYRSSLVEDKIEEMIEDGSLMIDVKGKKVGQINGLSIYAAGGYSFGRPSRITARTYLGEEGVIAIEREIELSGPIHSKGILTLTGYLGGQYAQEFPLSISASITFEQLYDGVEGDSASSAELYALLSSLAETPLRQDVAVTGSVNQYGQIQPIGGVNEKIEGFYTVCKAMGLTGEQGVMIPAQNMDNLVLRDEVVEAVRQGRFHIWVVRTVDEGLEHLTGLIAGERLEGGGFTPGSLHERVYHRLGQFAQWMKEYGAG